MTATEFIDWYKNSPIFKNLCPSAQMLYEMESEGYTFDVVDGAPKIISPVETR